MDPLIIHHVIRHRLSRIETNNFQDKSGCSINGIRSFLFEEGIVRDLDDIANQLDSSDHICDYRGYPIKLWINNYDNFPLSDEIFRMKNVNFYFGNQSKPIHKLVSPEPHFVEEERNLLENHFSYLGSSYESDDVEEWECFEMDNEGHLVSLNSSQISRYQINFRLSNEKIEHLSNFPHLRKLETFTSTSINQSVTNFSLLSNLVDLSIDFEDEFQAPESLQDLGLFSNLLILSIGNSYFSSNALFFDIFPFLYYIFIFIRSYNYSSLFFQLIQSGLSWFGKLHFSRF